MLRGSETGSFGVGLAEAVRGATQGLRLPGEVRRGAVSPDPRYLLIAWDADLISHLHLFHDLDAPSGDDDALVVRRDALGGTVHPQADSLRELLVWRELLVHRIDKRAQRLWGCFRDEDGNFPAALTEVLEQGGLAAARFAQQHQELAFSHCKRGRALAARSASKLVELDHVYDASLSFLATAGASA